MSVRTPQLVTISKFYDHNKYGRVCCPTLYIARMSVSYAKSCLPLLSHVIDGHSLVFHFFHFTLFGKIFLSNSRKSNSNLMDDKFSIGFSRFCFSKITTLKANKKEKTQTNRVETRELGIFGRQLIKYSFALGDQGENSGSAGDHLTWLG